MSEPIQSRPYQDDAIRRFYDEVRAGNKRVMLCAPTGAGKMVIAIKMLRRLAELGKRVNFIVDRTVLVRQASLAFHRFGLRHGVEAGANSVRLSEPIMIRSAQTMRSRRRGPDEADLNVVDEAHITHRYIAQRMSEGVWLGLSASPFKEGLGDLFDTVVNVSTTRMLRDEGYLAPLKIYCGVPMEVSKKSATGEYDAEAAGAAAVKIVGDIVGEWEAKTQEHFGGPAKTIVFGNTVSDCHQIASAFSAAGHDFRAVSYLDEQGEKERLVAALERGEIMGLVSCEMLQRGFDVPDIMVGIDAHPWRRSLSCVVQQCGRAMRIAPGKPYALWLDHAQNCIRHRDRLLDFWDSGIDELVALDKEAGEDSPDREEAVCPECGAFMTSKVCAECGWERPVRVQRGDGEGMMVVDGHLVALDDDDPRKFVARVGRKEYEVPPPAWGWGGLCRMAQIAHKDADRGQRWCQAQFHKLYGRFHQGRYDPERSYNNPTPELQNAVEHSLNLYIAGLKRQGRTGRVPRRVGYRQGAM